MRARADLVLSGLGLVFVLIEVERARAQIVTPSATARVSATPTARLTPSATASATARASGTATVVRSTPTGSVTTTATATRPQLATATATGTRLLTQTATATRPPTPSATATLLRATATASGIATPRVTSTSTSTVTRPLTATATASRSPTPSGTATLPRATATASRTATARVTSTATALRTTTRASTPTATARRTSTPREVMDCPGDCDGDGQVVIAELIRAVGIALGLQPLSTCPSADADASGAVTVSDLIRMVSAALEGCPSEPPCADPGADPQSGCTSCRKGFHLENAFGIRAPEGFASGDDPAAGPPPARAEERLRCVPDLTCGAGGLDCGVHGRCVASRAGTAGCACDPGHAGPRCAVCLPPYEPGADGRCVLGAQCGAALCSSHGTCVASPVTGEIRCVCDAGFSGPDCAPVEFRLIKPVRSVDAGRTMPLRARLTGTGCGQRIVWRVAAGGGSITGDGAVATFTAPTTVDGLVDIVTIAAAPEGCPELEREAGVHVVPAGIGPIIGIAERLLEEVDQAVLEFMGDHGMPGGSVTISFSERVLYNKAFGIAKIELPPGPGLPVVEFMTPGHVMRLASVSKPITRAAIRQLQADGLLAGGANGLNDLVFSILQTEGNNLLGLDGNNVPLAPLQTAEYQTGGPGLCDTMSPPNCPPVMMTPPLMCPIGTQGGGTCPLGTAAGSAPGFALTQYVWNLDGNNPRVGGTPQYDCPTDDTGQLDVAVWQQMTVADLFWHRGGFYRGAGYVNTLGSTVFNISGDITYVPAFVSRRLPITSPPPPTALDMVRAAAGSCLYFQPVGCDDSCCTPGNVPQVVDPFGFCTELDGDTYANIGYNLLGRIIEIRSGMSYGSYVTQKLLAPNGIEDIRLGKTRPQDRDPREPHYYTRGEKLGPDLFSAACSGDDQTSCSDGTWIFPNQVAVPDGGDFALEYRDAQGGWTATSCALVEFLKAYRVSDGFPRMGGVFPTGGEGAMLGAFEGTRAYVGQWGDPITIVDTETVPDGCTDWSCLDSADVNLPLGAGFHIAAIFNKRACEPDDCDVEGGYDFTKHSTAALPNHIAQGLAKLTAVPLEQVICGCGNGLKDAGEQCDGDDLGGTSCVDVGFQGGLLACKADCTYDLEPCSLCGNGVRNADKGEVCDGTDFGGVSCATFGFTMGSLTCNACLSIDTSGCSGGMAIQPPASYQDCGFAPAQCAGGTCTGAQGDCAGGPCKMTNPSDYTYALIDPLNTQGGEFHPDGNFRDAQGNLYYCQHDGSTHMVCIDQNGWGVCRRCLPGDGPLNTMVGCPCTNEETCEAASEPGLGCFGENFGAGTGFCWNAQQGPPPWQCVEGICGMAPYYGNDTMYCEHYPVPGGPARCEPWFACNAILARVCAGGGLICAENAGGCTESNCCAPGCELSAQCGPAFGWPPGYSCTNTAQGLQCVGP